MPTDPPSTSADLESVATLGEPMRRRLYDVVAASSEPLSREEAAGRAGVAVHTARFHLDRLAEEGLVEVEFRRLSGRTGPGAGRPAKLYRRGPREISVTLPSRHYDLLGRILATAVAEADGATEPVRAVAERVARDEGRSFGASVPARGRDLTRVARALEAGGYEPVAVTGEVRARNCPFHRVAQVETELVCTLNVAYVAGVCDGLGCSTVTAELEPHEGACCVVVRSSAPS